MRVPFCWLVAGVLGLGALGCTGPKAPKDPDPAAATPPDPAPTLPTLVTDTLETDSVGRAFHLALGTIRANVRAARPNVQGMAAPGAPLMYAGIDYYGPWTRDASVSIWNGAGLLLPAISKNTLYSLLDTSGNQPPVIGGQYWDRLLWTVAAWQYYLYNGDREFLQFAYDVSNRTARLLHDAEFNDSLGLYRGPSVFNDGISAYPDRYTRTGTYTGGEWVSDITKWAHTPENKPKLAPRGFGLPMFTLSTNCVYYQAYKVMAEMAKELGKTDGSVYTTKADGLRSAIDRTFWRADNNGYWYLTDPEGADFRQEGMGYAFALLFDVPTQQKAQTLLSNAVITPAGIPCLHPTYERYQRYEGGAGMGRHSGPVWGHIKGLWGQGALRHGNTTHFQHELKTQTRMALRDGHFAELYHPQTTLPYGGWQEDNLGQISLWQSAKVQTWAATGYLRMVLYGLLGFDFQPDGLHLAPNFPQAYPKFELRGLRYRGATVSISIKGAGKSIKRMSLNGQPSSHAFVPANATGDWNWEIELK